MGLETDLQWQDLLYDLGWFGQDWLAANRAGNEYLRLRVQQEAPPQEARQLCGIDAVVAAQGWTAKEATRLLDYIEALLQQAKEGSPTVSKPKPTVM